MVENTDVMEKQLVVFSLAGSHYGVDILTVTEIIRMQAVTRLPVSVPFLEGLINLRGILIPVIDLRKRFGLDNAEDGEDNHIVVVHSSGQDIGMMVDSVTEVLNIPSGAIEPPPAAVLSSDAAYLLGTARLEDKLVMLIDVNRLLSRGDITAVSCPV